jgi:hypothetical protein
MGRPFGSRLVEDETLYRGYGLGWLVLELTRKNWPVLLSLLWICRCWGCDLHIFMEVLHYCIQRYLFILTKRESNSIARLAAFVIPTIQHLFIQLSNAKFSSDGSRDPGPQ